jgi:Uma2 family endonuclease
MRLDIHTPPRTIMEVFKMLPEGALAELIEGTLYISLAPNTNHQRIAGKIFIGLSAINQGGEAFIAPFDVFLDEVQNAVQPDVIYVSKQNLSIIKNDAIHGVPDLLVEVISPGNSKHDLVLKKDLYQKFGVKEYWIIDPETKETTGYSLKDGIYIECGRYSAKVYSVILQQEFAF